MIGTRLGQYRIDALLGQGGMGAVYLATDEMLGRQVAIKVLRDDADAQGTATERFRSEAQILARLDHPHILRLYGFSQHEGVLYMVTEFVKGEALQKRLERGGLLDVPQVLEWAGQVLDALDYAHQLGVVHRDIKPANILIDERNRARLLDFGIARIVGTEGPTQTGHAVGTLTYMAPEQVLDEDIDGRADIYAFAVVICQMLAGRRPYRATTTAGLIREIVDGPAPDVASLLPPHAASFVPALLHALARQPADRTPTAGEMRRELQAAGATPVLTPPPLPPLVEVAIPTATGQVASPGTGAVATGTVRRSDTGATTSGPVVPVTGSTPIPPPMVAAPPAAANPPVPTATRRRPGAIAYAIPAVLVLAAAGVGWALFGPSRLVTPRVVSAPAETGSTGVSAEGPDASTSQPTQAPVDTTADAALAAPAPGPVPEVPVAPAPVAVAPRPSAGAAVKGAASPRVGTGVSSPAATAPTPVAPAPPPPPDPTPEPAPAPAATAAAVPATIEFKDLILMDRVDDEDEEIDVSVRLDQKRVVVLDEDGIAKRSIGYESIARATYNARKPGRFSLRRGASHWLTLEVGTTPVVLRLNGKSYEQVLTTLAGHGVHVERQP